jgi:purine-binding chemotaxis protein CheW
MQNAALEKHEGQSEVVSFRVAEQDYCIDIGYVREIRGWTPVTAIPHSPSHIKGVINLRGTIIAVIDLAARLGLGVTEPTPRHVIIIVTIGAQTVGLLADLVSEISSLESEMKQPVPEQMAELSGGFLTFIGTLTDGRMLRGLDMSRILTEVQ